MLIAVDFDGTCVRHEFPEVGADVPGAVATLRALLARGDRLILWTVRSGAHLDAAVEWFRVRNLELWGVNVNPDQAAWSSSQKVYAEVFIDDAALGCPLMRPPVPNSYALGGRPFVDWIEVWKLLGLKGDVTDPKQVPDWFTAGDGYRAGEPVRPVQRHVFGAPTKIPETLGPGGCIVGGDGIQMRVVRRGETLILDEATGVSPEVMQAVDALPWPDESREAGPVPLNPAVVDIYAPTTPRQVELAVERMREFAAGPVPQADGHETGGEA